jgi:hypothetical protein
MDSHDLYIYLTYIVLFLLMAGLISGRFSLGFRKPSSQFNSTARWTPVPDFVAESPPAGTILTPHEHRIIAPYLEPDEELEGFARASFRPPRLQDFGFGRGMSGLPVLIAATPRRLLMFEVTLLTLHRYCSIPYENIEYLRPPQAGAMGTSGPMRLGLKSGLEYQLVFFGPLFSDEGMRYEQRLATYLRWLAPRFPSARPQLSAPPQAAA